MFQIYWCFFIFYFPCIRNERLVIATGHWTERENWNSFLVRWCFWYFFVLVFEWEHTEKINQHKRHVNASHWDPIVNWHISTACILTRIAGAILVKIPVEMCQFTMMLPKLVVYVGEFLPVMDDAIYDLQTCSRGVFTFHKTARPRYSSSRYSSSDDII